MGPPTWHPFGVDGERFYWTSYSTKTRDDGGPWQRVEFLVVGRRPEKPGVGCCYPAGTPMTEEYAVRTVRLFLENGEVIP